ncbi:hypothetical protein FISHEDRAFT_49090 [Fistulina hepatica ATCC 64428]|uniref:RTA1-domain-containing protein n=1 Tax=Fistulina hepatica ATCC 64428 TaxID=1128425 RepID=A0A0D7A494_9AGAR|nr:hypothetical protein FISHEDRAFT_49090 [Fistulina hepatica ATCC 64428]
MSESLPYGYVPTFYVTVIFVALFSASGLLHIAESICFRVWWLLPTAALSCMMEVLGWIARLWSSWYLLALLVSFFVFTWITGPTPLLAANFVILENLVHKLGVRYSRLDPKWYIIIFCSCDIISLVVQGYGGATAAVAVGQSKNPDTGGNIMLGGMASLLFSMTLFVLTGSEFVWRYFTNRPIRKERPSRDDSTVITSMRTPLSHGTKLMLGSLVFSVVCLFIRTVYRTIELQNGFSGTIIRTQVYFNVLDGAMIVLASFTMNFFHPGYLLNDPVPNGDDKIEGAPSEYYPLQGRGELTHV